MSAKLAIFIALICVSLELTECSVFSGLSTCFGGKSKLSWKRKVTPNDVQQGVSLEQQCRSGYEGLVRAKLHAEEYQFLRGLAHNLHLKVGHKPSDGVFVFRPDRAKVRRTIGVMRTAPVSVIAENLIETLHSNENSAAWLVARVEPIIRSKDSMDEFFGAALKLCGRFVKDFEEIVELCADGAKRAHKDDYGSKDVVYGWFILNTCYSFLNESPEKLRKLINTPLPQSKLCPPRVEPAEHNSPPESGSESSLSVEKSDLRARELQYRNMYEERMKTRLTEDEYGFLYNMTVDLYYQLGYEPADNLFVFVPSDKLVNRVVKAMQMASIPTLAISLTRSFELCGQGCERLFEGFKFDDGYDLSAVSSETIEQMIEKALDLCRKFLDGFGELIKLAANDAAIANRDTFGFHHLRDGWFIKNACYGYLTVNPAKLTRVLIDVLQKSATASGGSACAINPDSDDDLLGLLDSDSRDDSDDDLLGPLDSDSSDDSDDDSLGLLDSDSSDDLDDDSDENAPSAKSPARAQNSPQVPAPKQGEAGRDADESRYMAEYQTKMGEDFTQDEHRFLYNLAVNLYFQLGFEIGSGLFKFRPDMPVVKEVVEVMRRASTSTLAESLVKTYRQCGSPSERVVAGSKFDEGVLPNASKKESMVPKVLDLCRRYKLKFGALIKSAEANARDARRDDFGMKDLRDGWYITSACDSYLGKTPEKLMKEFFNRLPYRLPNIWV